MRQAGAKYLKFKFYLLIAGNSNLVYTIIRKRAVFHSLANMATDPGSINRSLMRKSPLTKKPSKGKLDLIKEKTSKGTEEIHG